MQEIQQALKDYEIVLNEMIQRFLQLEKSINEEKQSCAITNANYYAELEQLKSNLIQLKQYQEQNNNVEKLQSISNYQYELLSKIDRIQQSLPDKAKVKKSIFKDFFIDQVGIAAIFLLCFTIIGILLVGPKVPEANTKQSKGSVSPEAIKYAFIKSLPQASLKKIIATVDTLYIKQGPAIMQRETEKNLKKTKGL